MRPRPSNQVCMDNRSRSRGCCSLGTSSLLWEAPFLSLQTSPPPRDSPTKKSHQKPSSTFLVVAPSLKLPAAQVPSKHTLAGHKPSLWGTRCHPTPTGYLRSLPPLALTCRFLSFFSAPCPPGLDPWGQRSHPRVALLKYTSSFAFSIRLDQSHCIGGETYYQGPR